MDPEVYREADKQHLTDGLHSNAFMADNNMTQITTKQKLIYKKQTAPWTSEAKTHGKAYKHLKVNLDFIISGKEKREKGGDVGMP